MRGPHIHTRKTHNIKHQEANSPQRRGHSYSTSWIIRRHWVDRRAQSLQQRNEDDVVGPSWVADLPVPVLPTTPPYLIGGEAVFLRCAVCPVLTCFCSLCPCASSFSTLHLCPHWSPENISSTPQFLIGWLCLSVSAFPGLSIRSSFRR